MTNDEQGKIATGMLIFAGVSVAIAVVLLTVFSSIRAIYNNWQLMDEGTNKMCIEVQNQYQRRSDLIPALVSTVQGEANFEKSTLTAVIEARSKASSIQLTEGALKNPEAMAQFQKYQGDLTSALSKLMMLTENYPQLRANDAFKDLRVNLEGTENRIAVARNRCIASTSDQNGYIRTFPNNVIASFFNMANRPNFTADTNSSVMPKVEFK